MISNRVTSVGAWAFAGCSLTSITVGSGVTSLGTDAFGYCPNLTAAYFKGNAPGADCSVFESDNNLSAIYYLPETTGWETAFACLPTAPWALPVPLILNLKPVMGMTANAFKTDADASSGTPAAPAAKPQPGFNFTVAWAANATVIVDACTDLANPVWIPVATNALARGTLYFSDPQWTNYPSRFYRVRSP